ncbi:MAG TPA: DeoR/GlpR family DNA-binding transcription regulator [Patescibacteria group bacterium]|nr:DeoR/GlpR family DNA-binding transcription regulator [Patescibacteria group bacterium]
MLAVKRLEEIMGILSREGAVDATSLSLQFNVTTKTVRKDLDKLEILGMIERVHGGAVLKQDGSNVLPVEDRKKKHLHEKILIAQQALQCIDDGDTIILDGGSTTIQLAKLLGDRRLTVITNDLHIALELMYRENIELFLTGGKLRRQNAFTLQGRDAERVLEKYQVKKLFLGTTAIDFAAGLTVLSAEEADMKKAMIRAAREVICLADHTKFHQVAFVSFCPVEKVQRLITDGGISEEDRLYLQERGVRVDIAGVCL